MVTPTPTRRLVQLCLIAVLLGFVGGGAASVLVHLIDLITNLALFHRWSTSSPDLAQLDPGWPLFVAAVLGALAISGLARWAPVIRGHGIPEAMDAVLTKGDPTVAAMPAAAPAANRILRSAGETRRSRRLPVGEFWHPVIGGRRLRHGRAPARTSPMTP
jgi:H+/Cl- antiporter ClcA